jgi:RimJ/RimL family protein N-acetyltransferase
MSAGSAIRRLGPDDAAALVSLRREALETDPLAFGASPEDDALSLESAPALLVSSRQDRVVFGLFLGADLAGMVGVRRDRQVKRRHVAIVWGMYVTPPARGKGRSRALLQAALEQARRWPGVDQVELAVSDTAVAARRLYESLGFRSWGREPRALQWQGRFVDDHHLVLDLRALDA